MQLVLIQFAMRINKIDRLRGCVVERRFAEIVILDHDALARRIAYAINNPVEADLVRSHHDWLGLCFFSGASAQKHAFTVFNETRYQRALEDAERSGASVERSSFYETAELEIAALDAELAQRIAVTVDEREAELRKAQTRVLGMERVLKSSPFDRPKISARVPESLC